MFSRGALADWGRSEWDRREVIHSGPEKVHIDTRFTRYRADGTVIAAFDSIYVVTNEDGHWGEGALELRVPTLTSGKRPAL